MMAASALPETLKSITAIKIQELTQQRNNFEAAKESIYAAASSAKDPISKSQALLDGTCRLKNVRLSDDTTDHEEFASSGPVAYQLRNKNLLLRQAMVDPSVDQSIVDSIQQSLEHQLELEGIRHQHAQFFSELVTEWLSNPDDEVQSSKSTIFEEVGRKEMHEQRATWEGLVFVPKKIDIPRVEDYLKKLFISNKASNLAHEDVVKRTKNFGSELMERKEVFNPESLKGTMAGLLSTDLLSKEKNATLRTFMTNKEVLKEVADVLNMRYESLHTWKWTTSGTGIPVEMRRQLNGKYRVFMDEDVLDAILLYEIGLKWSVHFKAVLTVFFNSFAWKRSEKVIPKKDRERREFFLENDRNSGYDTVQSVRRATYSSDYFLTQLPIDERSGKRNYNEDNSDDDDEDLSTNKSPLELKHGLLHMLVAESLIAKTVSPDITHCVIRSDFKWFGPGLPHDTIFTILKFFGVDDLWLGFFRKFLEAPMYFVHDGPEAQTQTRKRGIPLSHTISDFLGEAFLFVMDFAVNQATSSYLYRLHDDFWLWGSEENCLKGWQSMTKFANIMGIEFNEEKTGTVKFNASADDKTSDSEDSASDDFVYGPGTTTLPSGQVRWGFLRLDANSGRFLVDQSQVDEHIKELKLQLSCCQSICSYIQSYNAYVGRFFTNNFGRPSYAFGRDHIDMMISTFARIQKALFPTGSVTDHLSSLASQRFNIQVLPQGFWYFPVQQGGLELRNPLITLLGMREQLRQTPDQMLQQAYNEDEAEYLRAEQSFKDRSSTGRFGSHKSDLVRQILDSGETFMPLKEYMHYREERSRHLGALYKRFLVVPDEQEFSSTPELEALVNHGNPALPPRKGKGDGIVGSFETMKPYWKWVVALYGKDIVERYGSVSMVDGGQVPLGVVSLMKKERVRWRG